MQRDRSLAWQPVDTMDLDLRGLQVAIVGGTGGIGRAVSHFLASHGAQISVIGQTFRDADVPGIKFIKADLSSMKEAQRVAELLPAETLDLVIFTTGIFAAPQRQVTSEGIERDMAVSYLNRLVILRGIAPRLGRGRPESRMKPRVFIMGYPGTGQIGTLNDLNSEISYRAMRAHMNTVAGNEMLVLDAAKRYANATFFGLNPGLIKTNIRDNFFGKSTLKSRVMEMLIGLLTPTADTYARRIAPLLVSPDIEQHSGALFNRKGQVILPSAGLTDEHIQKFMSASETLVTKADVSLTTK